MLFSLALFTSSALAGLQCLPASVLEYEKLAIQGQIDFAIKALDVDAEAMKLFGMNDTTVIDDLQKGLSDLKEGLTGTIEHFEKAACATCEEHVKAFDAFVSWVQTAMEAVDKNWQKNSFFKCVNDLLEGIEKFGAKACPEPTTAALTDSTCLAGDVAEKALSDLTDILNAAKAGLKSAENMRVVGPAAKIAYSVVVEAEGVLNEIAPQVASDACTACDDLSKAFDAVKAKIEAVVGKLGHPGIEKAVDGVLNAIDMVLQKACPSPSLSATDDKCLAQGEITKILDDAKLALEMAENDLAQAVSMPTIGPIAAKLLDVVKEAEKEFDADGPKLEAMTCVFCEMMQGEVEKAKTKIIDYLKVVNNARLTMFAEKVLDDLDTAFKKECATSTPSELAAPAADCMAKDLVSEFFDGTEMAVEYTLNELKKLEKDATIGGIAKGVYTLVYNYNLKFKAGAAMVEGMACATCDKLESLFDDAVTNIDAALAQLNCGLADDVKALLAKAEEMLKGFCASKSTTTVAPKTTSAPKFLMDGSTCVKSQYVADFFDGAELAMGMAMNFAKKMEAKNGTIGTMATMAYTELSAMDTKMKADAAVFEAAACASCQEISTMFDAAVTKVEAALSKLSSPVVPMIEALLNAAEAKLKAHCAKKPVTTTAKPVTTASAPPKALEAVCDVAGDKLEDMLGKVTQYLNDAGKELSNLSNLPVIGADAAKLADAIEEAAKLVKAVAPEVPSVVCMACEDVDAMFKKVSAKVEGVIDALFNEEIKKMAKRIIKGIEAGFQALCPGTPDSTSAAPKTLEDGAEDCIAGNLVEQTMDQLDTYLLESAKAVDAFSNNPIFGAEAKKLAEAISAGEEYLSGVIPMIAADVCTQCADLAGKFGGISKAIMSVVDDLGNQTIKDAAQTVLDTIDKGLQTLCPSM